MIVKTIPFDGQEVSSVYYGYNRYFSFVCIYQIQRYIITGLNPYQMVNVTITATNGGGTSDFSNVISSRTSEAGQCTAS